MRISDSSRLTFYRPEHEPSAHALALQKKLRTSDTPLPLVLEPYETAENPLAYRDVRHALSRLSRPLQVDVSANPNFSAELLGRFSRGSGKLSISAAQYNALPEVLKEKVARSDEIVDAVSRIDGRATTAYRVSTEQGDVRAVLSRFAGKHIYKCSDERGFDCMHSALACQGHPPYEKDGPPKQFKFHEELWKNFKELKPKTSPRYGDLLVLRMEYFGEYPPEHAAVFIGREKDRPHREIYLTKNGSDAGRYVFQTKEQVIATYAAVAKWQKRAMFVEYHRPNTNADGSLRFKD